MTHVIAGIFYGDAEFNGHDAYRLEFALIAFNLIAVAAAFGLYLFTEFEIKFKYVAFRKMSRVVDKVVRSLQEAFLSDHVAFFDALKEAKKAVLPLGVGVNISHEAHGPGIVIEVNLDDSGKKVFTIEFENGELTYFDEEAAAKRIQARNDAHPNTPSDAVTWVEFEHAAMRCLQRGGGTLVVSATAIEALFLFLRFIDAEADLSSALAPHRNFVSIDTVTSHPPLPAVQQVPLLNEGLQIHSFVSPLVPMGVSDNHVLVDRDARRPQSRSSALALGFLFQALVFQRFACALLCADKQTNTDRQAYRP